MQLAGGGSGEACDGTGPAKRVEDGDGRSQAVVLVMRHTALH